MEHVISTAALLLAALVLGTDCHDVLPLCDKSEDICEISLELKEYYTMMKGVYNNEDITEKYKPIVIKEDGTSYVRMNETYNQILTAQELKDIPLGDGSYKRVLLYNGQLPGPPIVVYEGQQVVVRLKNSLSDQGTTIHFHGAKQLNTPWMDGVSGVSQCNINPGESFTYRFKASPVGTHWYHSHYGSQRSQGAAGAFIVLDPNDDKDRRKKDELPNFDSDYYMVIQDWMRQRTEDIFTMIAYDTVKYPYDYNTDICYNSTKQADGVDSGVLPYISALINGVGRYKGQDIRYPEKTYVPYEVFQVKNGSHIRFRVVTASMMFPLRVSIDHHPLYVIASDGSHVKKQKYDSIIIFNGERFDFYIEADNPMNIGNYWIRVENLQRMQNGERIETAEVNAILRYNGHKEDDPKTEDKNCTARDQCHILNCPYEIVPEEDHWECHPITVLRKVDNEPTLEPATEKGEEIHEYFLNFHFAFPAPGVTEKPTVNGIQHQLAVSSPMTFPSSPDGTEQCEFVSCATGLCRTCEHRLNLPLNALIQFNIVVTVNNAPGVINGNDHPIHIHGHHMQVLKVSYPTYDPETYFYANTSSDFTCVKPDCNTIVWTNESWNGGNIPGLLHQGAPRKDSMVVPVGGYIVTRFRTDNPGYWYMHCHVEFHNAEGMGLVIKAGEEEEMNDKPENMQTCGNFYFSEDTDKSEEATPVRCDGDRHFRNQVVVTILGVSCIFMSFLLFNLICILKLPDRNEPEYTAVNTH